MAGEFEEKRRRQNVLMRSIYDYVMGILWVGVGGFFLLYRKLGIEMDFDPVLTTIFGIASLLYGSFRIYRGYKK